MAKRRKLRFVRKRGQRVRVFSGKTELHGAARSAAVKKAAVVKAARTRRKPSKARKPKARPVPVKRPDIIRLPGRIHADIRSGFRQFITPVRYLKGRAKRQAYVMIRIDEPSYRIGEDESDVIIPIRLGSFTKKQLQSMTEDDLEEIAGTHPKWKGRVETLGVYVRKGK